MASPHNRLLDLSSPEALACQMQSRQPRRTGRIDREARSAKVEEIRDPIRKEGVRTAHELQPRCRRRVPQAMHLIVREAAAHEHTNVLSVYGVIWEAPVLQSLVGAFKQDSVSRIERSSLVSCDIEKGGVKGRNVPLKIVCPFQVELNRISISIKQGRREGILTEPLLSGSG